MTATAAAGPLPWTPVPDAFWTGLRRLIAPYVLCSFVVPGNPQPKERPRLGAGGHTITPARTKQAEVRVHTAFREAMPDWQPDPDGTYGILLEFHTEQGSSADLDNCTKLVWDALNTTPKRDGLWQDDIQVGMALLRLVRGGDPNSHVWVFGMTNNGTPLSKVCECGNRYRAKASKCSTCTKRRSGRALLLCNTDDAQAAAELDQLKRRAFSYLAACTMGGGRAPSVAKIAQQLTVTEARARTVVDALIQTGSVARRNRTLEIVRPLGETTR